MLSLPRPKVLLLRYQSPSALHPRVHNATKARSTHLRLVRLHHLVHDLPDLASRRHQLACLATPRSGTHLRVVALQLGQDVLDCALGEDPADELEALAVGLLGERLFERLYYEPADRPRKLVACQARAGSASARVLVRVPLELSEFLGAASG